MWMLVCDIVLGEMTFAEYSSLLEKSRVKDEPVELQDVASYQSVETTPSADPAPPSAAGNMLKVWLVVRMLKLWHLLNNAKHKQYIDLK